MCWLHSRLSSLAVPLFFVISGFFFAKGLQRQNTREERWNYCKRYAKRLILLYAFWSIGTLPISWTLIIGNNYGDSPIWFKILYQLRLFFLTGSLGIYWYILAMICCSIMLYYVYEKRCILIASIFALVMWSLGTLYESNIYEGSILNEAIHTIWGSSRNFLNIGFPYMFMGLLLACYNIAIRKRTLCIILGVLLLLRELEVAYLNVSFVFPLLAMVIFLLFKQMTVRHISEKVSKELRALSTAIYLLQFPFLLLFDFRLQRGSYIDFFATLGFCCLTYYISRKILPMSVIKYIYG